MTHVNLNDLQNQSPIVPPVKPRDKIAHLLNSRKKEIEKMLPKHLNAERLMKVAQIAATSNAKLAECDIPSLIGAIGQCAQMGLEPNTVLGHAYLVPFNTKRKDSKGNERYINSVQVVIGYRGLIDLARRSGQIVSIAAHEVYEQDKFELEYGLDEKLIHVPSFEEIKGEVIGFYAVAKLVGGGYAFEFMSARQVDLIRDNTQSKGRYGPWKDHYVEMGRKTVIRRLSKYLPLSVEFQMANSLDEQSANEKDQHLDTFDGEFSILADTYETEQPPAVEHQPGETLDFGTAQTAVEQEPVETRSSKPAQHKQSKPIPPSDDFGPME